MINTIFVPASGTQADGRVFAAALAVARPLAAHLEFFHLRFSVAEAAERSPHVQFCVGAGINDALEYLAERDENLSIAALRHFQTFCESNELPVQRTPNGVKGVSADWIEETDQAEMRFMFHARHSDLVVLGRQHNHDLMPVDLIQWLLLGSGRPILIAPDSTAIKELRTVVVGWKETPEAARALAAAMPLLQQARRVVLVSVEEKHSTTSEDLAHLARQLTWHGIAAEAKFLSGKEMRPCVELAKVAHQLAADLVVVGCYGHTPLREAVWGGVTRSLIECSRSAVLLMH